jgi:TonB family protein
MKASLAVAAALLAVVMQDGVPRSNEIAPARLIAGSVPPVPMTMLSGGQVFLELAVDVDGRVAGVRTLRATPPLTSVVRDAVRDWRFEPSQRSIDSATETIHFAFRMARLTTVFVGAVYRAPVLVGPTLGTAPTDVATADAQTPMPVTVATPSFPPNAFCGGVVLVEAAIDATGSVYDARVVASAPPFDGAALDAARQFRFRPGRVDGVAAPSYAYLIFGFPQPITAEAP